MASSPPTSYAKDEEGGTFIAASQRPDGSWRKPRRVRDGYVPQEEVPLYESKGRQSSRHAPQYPVGLDPALIRAAEARKEKAARVPQPPTTIPGLSLDDAKGNKKKKKKKPADAADGIADSLSRTSVNETKVDRRDSNQTETETTPADPAKRLKNLRKRLRGIEAIEEKIASGELKTLEKDQIEKVARKRDVLEEIREMESMVVASVA